MLYILSQNKEKLYCIGGNVEIVRYMPNYACNNDNAERHFIAIGGEKVAEYDSKEQCLNILRQIMRALHLQRNANTVFELPPNEKN